MPQVLFHGVGHKREHVAVLLPAGFDHCEQRFHESAACCALRAKREFAPDHGLTQRPLRRIVRQFNASTLH